MYLEFLDGSAKSIYTYPSWKIVTIIESILVILIFTRYMIFFHTVIDISVLIVITIGIVYGALKLFHGHGRIKFISAVGVFLFILGLCMVILQVEISYNQGYIHYVNIFSIATSFAAMFIGIFLSRMRTFKLTELKFYFVCWNVSLLLLLYTPASSLLLTESGIGEGIVSFVGFGLIVSLISSTFFTVNHRKKDVY